MAMMAFTHVMASSLHCRYDGRCNNAASPAVGPLGLVADGPLDLFDLDLARQPDASVMNVT